MPFRPLVLCYHAVSEGWNDDLATPSRTLGRQVRWLLRRGYRAVSADRILSGATRTFHVTFDDAFRNISSALFTLTSLGVPVTVFACTSYAQDGRPLDIPELRERGAPARHELATMDWNTLRELADRGIEIGSHTVSHAHLPLLSDQELRRELSESKERLEDELGQRCRFLAYPFGQDDARVRAAAAAAQYEAAFTLRVPRGPVDRFAIARVGVYRGDRLARFAVKGELLRSPAGPLPDRLRSITAGRGRA